MLTIKLLQPFPFKCSTNGIKYRCWSLFYFLRSEDYYITRSLFDDSKLPLIFTSLRKSLSHDSSSDSILERIINACWKKFHKSPRQLQNINYFSYFINSARFLTSIISEWDRTVLFEMRLQLKRQPKRLSPLHVSYTNWVSHRYLLSLMIQIIPIQ